MALRGVREAVLRRRKWASGRRRKHDLAGRHPATCQAGEIVEGKDCDDDNEHFCCFGCEPVAESFSTVAGALGALEFAQFAGSAYWGGRVVALERQGAPASND